MLTTYSRSEVEAVLSLCQHSVRPTLGIFPETTTLVCHRVLHVDVCPVCCLVSCVVDSMAALLSPSVSLCIAHGPSMGPVTRQWNVARQVCISVPLNVRIFLVTCHCYT